MRFCIFILTLHPPDLIYCACLILQQQYIHAMTPNFLHFNVTCDPDREVDSMWYLINEQQDGSFSPKSLQVMLERCLKFYFMIGLIEVASHFNVCGRRLYYLLWGERGESHIVEGQAVSLITQVLTLISFSTCDQSNNLLHLVKFQVSQAVQLERGGEWRHYISVSY